MKDNGFLFWIIIAVHHYFFYLDQFHFQRYDMLLLERLLGHMINVNLENKVKDPQQWVDKVDQCSSIVNKMLKTAEENRSAVTITK